MRNKLKKINHHTKDPFVKCLINLIPDYLPKSFVENFKDYLTKSQTLFPKNPRSIISSGGLNFCDYAKIWIASNKIKGTPLSILQHGGGYLSSKISLIPFNEYRLCDQFLSWGWKVAESHPFRKKITPFYITKTHQINRKNNCKKILLITTNIPKSSFLLAHFNYFDIYHYMATQIKFINHLNTRRTKHLKLRLYKYDFGWKIKDYYKTHFPQIDIENSSTISLNKSLKTTKLVIIDHNSTSLLETLSKNIPTLLFWDKTMNQRISKDAQPFFKLLEDVQVLHTCPKSAALFVNDLNDNIEDWWQNPLRQKAIKEFCNKFAKKSNNLSSDIINKLINN
ncbi:MAG: LIC12162 family protein [Candidatus Margulisiibacteriota bacterium]